MAPFATLIEIGARSQLTVSVGGGVIPLLLVIAGSAIGIFNDLVHSQRKPREILEYADDEPVHIPVVGVHTQLQAIPVMSSPVIDEPAIAGKVIPTDRHSLIQQLKVECPALLRLIKSHPIRAVGLQRSGKTTLVKKLALLRMILLPGHRVVAATPHHKPGEGYPNAFKVAGITPQGKRDYPAIAREWRNMSDGVESNQDQNQTYIWDEFGSFNKAVDEETIQSVLASTLKESMKFGVYPVIILHGETAAFMPGSKGMVTVILDNTVRVETIGEAVPDEIGLETIRPTGKFTVTWTNGSKEEGTIPDWLTDEFLLSMLPVQPIQVAETVAEPVHQSQTDRPKASVSLEQQIVDIIKEYRPGGSGVKLRDIYRNFRNEDSKKIEDICQTLERCYPTKFRINRKMVGGMESVRIEYIS